MKNYFSHIIYLLVFVSCPVIGQVSENSNEKVVNDKVNNIGVVTFFKNYLNTEKLCLYDMKSGKKLEFENITNTTVLTDEWFLGIDIKTNEVIVVDLQKFTMQRFAGIGAVEWIEPYNRLVGFNRQLKVLTVFNPATGIEKTFDEITHYAVCNNQGQLSAVTSFGKVSTYGFKDGQVVQHQLPVAVGAQIKKILCNSEDSSYYIFGNDNRDIIVFRTDNIKSVLKYKGKLHQRGKEVDTLFKSVRLLPHNKLILGMRKDPLVNLEKVEVWGEDDGLKSFRKKQHVEAVGLIDTKKGVLEVIDYAAGMQPTVTDNGELYATEEVDDITNYIPNLKMYRYNYKLKQFQYVAKVTGNHQMMYTVSGLPFLFYLEGYQWKRFDPKNKSHTVVTRNMYNAFAKHEDDFVSREHTLIQKLVLLDDKFIVFKDSRDLWLYDINKNFSSRITSGREYERMYDFSSVNYSLRKEPFGFTYTRKISEFGNYILHWKDVLYAEEGLSLLDEDYEEHSLIRSSHSYSQLKRSKNKLTYVKENGSFPPTLFLYDLKSNKEVMVYQTNLHDSLAIDQRTEYHTWEDKDGNKTGAIVRYPVGYDSTKKYPAILDIYERKKQNRLHYQSPDELSMTGFNYRDYTLQGYFVIEPDIHHKYGNPGYSATECVLTAIDNISSVVPIDKNRLGLIGHSFGGYETNFILTQTDIFKVAVSGAGIFDIVNWYHSVNWLSGRPEIWRFYHESYRMGAGFTEISDKYYDNSPLTHVDHINTPVLLWTGKEDYQVNWNQSISMYLALKDRKKNVRLLLYPKEGHVLENRSNQKDLSEKVNNWFDSYLKE